MQEPTCTFATLNPQNHLPTPASHPTRQNRNPTSLHIYMSSVYPHVLMYKAKYLTHNRTTPSVPVFPNSTKVQTKQAHACICMRRQDAKGFLTLVYPPFPFTAAAITDICRACPAFPFLGKPSTSLHPSSLSSLYPLRLLIINAARSEGRQELTGLTQDSEGCRVWKEEDKGVARYMKIITCVDTHPPVPSSTVGTNLLCHPAFCSFRPPRIGTEPHSCNATGRQ